jgi:P4 family phage/plasmid primase-like protien
MTELKEIRHDPTFLKRLNRETFVLPLKNRKMINLQTLEVYDRTIENLFSYECDVNYVENLNEVQTAFAQKYFQDLFCGSDQLVQCVLDIVKSAITGKILRFVFICTGDGRNGKSLFFKLLSVILGGAMDVISKNVVVQSKQHCINTEFEKLDKCRIGWVSELKDTDRLADDVLRSVCGGDPLDLRGLFKTNVSMYPTANIFGLVNNDDIPSFEPSKQNTDRIHIIPFKNNFPINTKFEEELIANRDAIFSYILQKGTIRDDFDFPEEMKQSKREVVNDNRDHSLASFIESECVIDISAKVKREELRTKYNQYCRLHSLPNDPNVKHTKFTRRMKDFGYTSRESHGKVFYCGLRFKTNDDLEESCGDSEK